MPKSDRDRAQEDLALLYATGQGCLLPIVVILAGVAALLVGATVVLAQVDYRGAGPGLYPEAAYTLADPEMDERRTVATAQGRWTVLPDDQDCVAVDTQVLLTAPLERADAALELMDGTICTLDPAVRIFRQAIPCGQRDGVCDVNREPRATWWDVP